MLRCRACGLRQVAVLTDDSANKAIYDDEVSYRAFVLAEHALIEPRYPAWLAEIREALASGASGRLLDVGCGAGHFVKAAREAGFEAEGVELSSAAARLALELNGITVSTAPLEADRRDGAFDVVTLIGVLEHLADPTGLVRECRRLLKPGGLLFVYTPRWCSYDTVATWLARAGRSSLIDRRINRAHLQIFSDGAFGAFFGPFGFEVLSSARVCEYNLPVENYLRAIGFGGPGTARVLRALIRRGWLFRNNARLLLRWRP